MRDFSQINFFAFLRKTVAVVRFVIMNIGGIKYKRSIGYKKKKTTKAKRERGGLKKKS